MKPGAFIFSLVLLTSCIQVHLTENNILHPVKTVDINAYSWITEKYLEVNDSTRLHTLNTERKGQEHTFLFFKGNSGNMLSPSSFQMIEWFHELGFHVVAIDYQGFGKSSGESSLENVLDDAIEAFMHYSSADIPGELFVYGYSLGGWAAANVGSREDCVPIILEGAFVNPERIALARMLGIQAPRRWFANISISPELQQVNTHEAISRTQCPVLILHGENDHMIPPDFARELYGKVPHDQKALHIFPHSGHGNILNQKRTEMSEALLEFTKAH